MFYYIPFDIQLIIFDLLDFISKCHFRNISKYFYTKFIIKDLLGKYDKETKSFNSIPGLHKLNNDILYQYGDLEKLYATNNSEITNINFLTKLKELRCEYQHRGECGISDTSIDQLNLSLLCMDNNPCITNLNHMTNLKTLSACNVNSYYKCIIESDGIKNLNLDTLFLHNNERIKIIEHMTNLKCLNIAGNSGVDDSQLQKLTMLTSLSFVYNEKIKNIQHLTNLTWLAINSNITNDHIKNMDLTLLYMNDNIHISKINHLTQLHELIAVGTRCRIDNDSIRNLKMAIRVALPPQSDHPVLLRTRTSN